MRSVDVHQHLWPEAVLRVLERRGAAPKARWQDHRWVLDLAGEPTFEVDPTDHDPQRRADELTVDKALVALSSPVDIDALPPRDALAAIAGWQQAATELPPELGWWASTPAALTGGGEADIAKEAIGAGAAGVVLPADRLASPTSARTALPLLAAVADTGAPVFIHPGPTNGTPGEPDWWSPATRYVAQQQAAWHSFHHVVRPQLPNLRAVFALLPALPRFRPSAAPPGEARTVTWPLPIRSPSTTSRRMGRGR